MKKHLLLIFTALLPLVASAEKVEIDGIWYNLISKAKLAEVTFKGDLYYSFYDEYSGSITIPATVTYDGVAYSVKSIEDEAFSGCISLTAITIPESVTSIGDEAFYYCSSLTAINIPEGVTSIGIYTFYNCSSLTAINIPENVTSIGEGAFYECRSLTAINIPEGVTSIGSGAFYGCSSLSKVFNCSNLSLTKDSSSNGYVAYYAEVVHQGGELTTVGDFQFYTSDGIHSLVNYIGNDTEIGLPDSYNGENYKIGDYAFYRCSSLTAINIPEGVTSIGDGAFEDCRSLTTINIPEGVTSIGDYAFSNCWSLTTINIPEGVTSIGSHAFYRCSSLTAITIPEGVTSIGYCAFNDCSSLTAINIPESVTSIERSAFYYCSSLSAAHISSIEAWCKISFKDAASNPLFYARNLYLNGELVTELVISEGLTGIGDWAFYNCSSLTAIMLPKSVKSIGEEAFANCPELTDVYCHAETVPSTELAAFEDSYIEYATLHVPASALDSYRATAPWSEFGNIVALTDEDMGIEQLTMDNARITIYDLHGRRVATPNKDGIYIVDGKKVMVKIGM